MRHARRHGSTGHEFGGSGEDSFVAVVVTKLTGALLFILLLTMVIMALLPKAVDLPTASSAGEHDAPPPDLAITTPEALPEAIAGHPYRLALAAVGGQGPLSWSVVGELPEGLTLDAGTGRIEGTPKAGTPTPRELTVRVSDGRRQSTRATRLVVYQSDQPLTTPAWWKPGIPPIPWKAWLEQGFGFLLLALVHLVGMNALAGVERWSRTTREAADSGEPPSFTDLRRRFGLYRWTVRLASLSAMAALAVWLGTHSA